MRKSYQFSAREVSGILAAHVARTTGEIQMDDAFAYQLTVRADMKEDDPDYMTLAITITGKTKK